MSPNKPCVAPSFYPEAAIAPPPSLLGTSPTSSPPRPFSTLVIFVWLFSRPRVSCLLGRRRRRRGQAVIRWCVDRSASSKFLLGGPCSWVHFFRLLGLSRKPACFWWDRDREKAGASGGPNPRCRCPVSKEAPPCRFEALCTRSNGMFQVRRF